MQNHDEKLRDIARSVLPSTISVAHERRLIHKAERTRLRDSLHMTGIDDGEIPDRVYRERAHRVSRSDGRTMVQARRDADHLSSLIRWARHHADHDPKLIHATHEDRLRYFASVLPSNLAGRHALTHIDTALRNRRYNDGDARQRLVDSIQAAVLVILAAGCHADLNRRIRSAVAAAANTNNYAIPSGARPRLLHGAHDAAAFAQAIAYTLLGCIVLEFAKELDAH